MYSGFSAEQMRWLSEEALTYNHHEYGVTLDTFNSNPTLSSSYSVLSTSKDKQGLEFVSSMEGR